MGRGDTGRGPVRRPTRAWVVASRPDTLARLLEAVDTAGMIPAVVAPASAPPTPDGEVPPVAVLLDAAAVDGSATATMERFRRIAPRAAILVIADERPIRWLSTGATAALPAGTPVAAIALQLRNLHELGSEPSWEAPRRYGPFHHEPARASLRAAGTEVRCSPPLRALLLHLLRADGSVVPASALRRALRRSHPEDAADVRAHIRRLRACLDRTTPGLGAAVVTARGIGYRLDLERAASACEQRTSAQPRDSASSPTQGERERMT